MLQCAEVGRKADSALQPVSLTDQPGLRSILFRTAAMTLTLHTIIFGGLSHHIPWKCSKEVFFFCQL